MAASQSADSLIHHCLENRCCQIFNSCTLIDQRLNISFSKYTAPCRYRIDHRVLFRSFIQSLRIGVEQNGHLVDKRTCTPCTGPIHSLLDRLSVKRNLRIFAAQFNGHIRLRDQSLYSSTACDHFLFERNSQKISQRKTA